MGNPTASISRSLRFARLGAAIVFGMCIGLYGLGLFYWPGYIALHPDSILPFDWSQAEMNQFLSRIDLPLLIWIALKLFFGMFAAVSYCLIGLLIFVRRRLDWFGLYISAILVMYGTITSDQVFILAKIIPWMGPVLQSASVLTWAGWFMVFYLFPDGRFSPNWACWFAGFLLLCFGVDILVFQGKSPPPWLAMLMLLPIVFVIFSLVYRWRISGALQRQQIKWVLFSILVLIISLAIGMLSIVFPEFTRSDQPYTLFIILLIQTSSLLVVVFPLSIGFAMLRYRLWDVDLIIRRTLLYSVLTGILALVYFGGVTLLQSVFIALSGQQSPAALVISTLLIAALITPLRRRIQETIDRRFYRQKYDAERALAAFAGAARSETELGRLSNRLTMTVQQSLQPQQLSLWFLTTSKPQAKEG